MLIRQDSRIKPNFSEVIISLASPESILERSFGEVTQPETINYRTHKPEMNGLFCERIFGPVKDWECHCGKYKRIRYKGTICDRCGVEVTEKKVRRVRTGHIKLVVPIVHTWYFRSLPNKIAYLLGLSPKQLDQIIYYERYIVIQPGIKAEDGISQMDFLTEEEYLDIIDSLPHENQFLDNTDPNKFVAHMGAEALGKLISYLDLDELSLELRRQSINDTSQQRRIEALKRLKIIESFRDATSRIANNPAWMIMKIIPVIPPELRPLVLLEGGRFAAADLNDLYRRVIIRNNRLRRLIDIKAPEVILRNEKRMLQEAVDSLFDNSRKANSIASEGTRVLKSLSDVLKGKQGRFRQNLLGKRVDYSGRSVIVVGPELKLHECGLPKDMAVELFKPFIIRRLLERGIAKTVKAARNVIESKLPIVWEILENVLKGHPVLLNRAPTLHRLGIQAFQPKLVEGKAIQLHPLVCPAFNADFDGDQMAVHVPLSHEAVAEASLLMLSSHNILNPVDGSPVIVPTNDMVLGLYYLTKARVHTPEYPVKGEGMRFYSLAEVLIGINSGKVSLHAAIKVKVRIQNKDGVFVDQMIDTVAGRVVFNQHLPEEVGFFNELLTAKKLKQIISQVYSQAGTARTAQFLDDIKELGFQTAYKAGISMTLDAIKVPDMKYELIEEATKEVGIVWDSYLMGLITDNERYNQIIDIWTRVNTHLTVHLMNTLAQDQQGFNAIHMMMDSGAKGSKAQVRQLGGMRGLMAKPRKNLQDATREIIENPIIANFKEGLDVIEYFISAHGARKGLADTALKTADAGYLTRRLIDVAQDLIITEEDCGTLKGIVITTGVNENEEEATESIAESILGRTSLHDLHDPTTNQVLVRSGCEITEEMAIKIEKIGIKEIAVRSVLTCETQQGICVKCYGRNLATGRLTQIGEPVGIIAAQSIGEPGTQLTLRTFHVGGAAANMTIEATIKAKTPGIVVFEDLNAIQTTNSQGDELDVVIGRSCAVKILDTQSKKVLMYKQVPYGAYLKVKHGDHIASEQEIFTWDPYNAFILTTISGEVQFHAIEEGVTYKEEHDEQTGYKEKIIIESKDKIKHPSITVTGKSGEQINYNIPVKAHLIVEDGSTIQAGKPLVKIPRMISKSIDITGGLPRVIELFEARNPSNPSVVSEIDGFVTYGSIKRGSREIFVESKEGVKKKYLIPLSRHILVQDNDYVKASTPLSAGSISPFDILSIKGLTAVHAYLVRELQAVYRLQGVRINNKHFELIVRQMLNRVEVIESGDTTLLVGQTLNKFDFRKENDLLFNKKIVTDAGDSSSLQVGKLIDLRRLSQENTSLKEQNLRLVEVKDSEPAIARIKLQGITQASLDTKSFISAASFQDTIRVLSSSAIQGKSDTLIGLKENVIVGRLIPTGTGLRHYEKLIVGLKEDYEALLASASEVPTSKEHIHHKEVAEIR